MSSSYPFPRLNLMRSTDDTGSPLPTPSSDPFARLLAMADRQQVIEVVEIPDEDNGVPDKSDLPPRGVRCGRSLLFRCPLPPGWQEAQALLFERDAARVVTLLSHPALLDAAVWYRHIVEVSRTDAMPLGGGATARLHLLAPGRSELLLVCCRDASISLDRLPLFRRLFDERRGGPLSFPPLGADDLEQLVETLDRAAPEDRVVIAGTVEVVLDRPGIRMDLPPLSPASQSAPSPASAPPVQNTNAKGRQEIRHMPFETVNDPIHQMLAEQTKLVRRWAEAANDSHDHEPRFQVNDHRPLQSFGRRLAAAIQSGSFVNSRRRHPSRQDVLHLQSQIAHAVHKLKYSLNYPMPDEKENQKKKPTPPGRWVTRAEDLLVPNGVRSGSYLDGLVGGDGDPNKSIPMVDMALIAHCFRLPIEVWEVVDDEQFLYWLQQAKEGWDLFSFGGLARYDNSLRAIDLGPAPTPSSKAPRATPYVPPSIPADRLLRFEVDLPVRFSRAQALFFQDDGTSLTLISTKAQTNHNLLYEGTFQTPREDHPPLPAAWFNPTPPGKTETFVTLLVAEDAPLRLDEIELYRGGGMEGYRVLDCEQIADLRRRLFALPREQWCMLRKDVAVV